MSVLKSVCPTSWSVSTAAWSMTATARIAAACRIAFTPRMLASRVTACRSATTTVQIACGTVTSTQRRCSTSRRVRPAGSSRPRPASAFLAAIVLLVRLRLRRICLISRSIRPRRRRACEPPPDSSSTRQRRRRICEGDIRVSTSIRSRVAQPERRSQGR